MEHYPLQCVCQKHEDCQSFRSRNFTGPPCHTRFSLRSGKVPGRKRTERVYGAGCQSNMRRNDTIQSTARMPHFRCDQNADKTCSTSSRSGTNSTHVTNNFDLAVATPVFPHWVDHGSGSQQNMRWPLSFMSSHTESIMR